MHNDVHHRIILRGKYKQEEEKGKEKKEEEEEEKELLTMKESGPKKVSKN